MKREGGQDSNPKPYDQVVKVGEGWVDLEPMLLAICQDTKRVNILLDNYYKYLISTYTCKLIFVTL